ncbi:MAG: hypothetical protein ACC628_17850, partial [Pirellulaceae bacterium]
PWCISSLRSLAKSNSRTSALLFFCSVSGCPDGRHDDGDQFVAFLDYDSQRVGFGPLFHCVG